MVLYISASRSLSVPLSRFSMPRVSPLEMAVVVRVFLTDQQREVGGVEVPNAGTSLRHEADKAWIGSGRTHSIAPASQHRFRCAGRSSKAAQVTTLVSKPCWIAVGTPGNAGSRSFAVTARMRAMPPSTRPHDLLSRKPPALHVRPQTGDGPYLPVAKIPGLGSVLANVRSAAEMTRQLERSDAQHWWAGGQPADRSRAPGCPRARGRRRGGQCPWCHGAPYRRRCWWLV